MNFDDVPPESISAQLRALLAEGVSPEDAARRVLGPYGDTPLPSWAFDGVVRLARNLYRRSNRRAEDRGFRSHADKDAKLRLASTAFTLPGGQRKTWEQLSLADLEIKAAWLRATIDSLSVDLERIERAIELLNAHPRGTRLGDVEDWQHAIADPEYSDDPSPSDDRSQAA